MISSSKPIDQGPGCSGFARWAQLKFYCKGQPSEQPRSPHGGQLGKGERGPNMFCRRTVAEARS